MLALRHLSALVVPLLAACATAPIEREPIVTDRPDFTESSATVPERMVQAEGGYTLARADGVRTDAVGELLVRVAAGARTELRAGVSSYRVITAGGEHRRGLEDASVGAKVALLEAADYFDLRRPALSLVVGTTVPTGSRAIAEHAWQPGVKVVIGWPLTGSLAFTSNLNYTYASESGSRFGQGSGSASVGYAVADRVGTYLGYFGFLPSSRGGPDAGYVNGGATYLFTSELQLDARLGVGAGGAGHGSFAGIGLSRRW
jgi:hypothetical protein